MTSPHPGSGATSGNDGITWGDLIGTWDDLLQRNGTRDDVRHGRGRAGVALAAGGALTATATVTSAAAPVTREQMDMVIDQLAQVLTEMRRANPRWWATPTAMAIYTLINVLIAAGALYVANRDASPDDRPGEALSVTAPATPGPAPNSQAPEG